MHYMVGNEQKVPASANQVFGAVPRLNEWQIDRPRVASVGDADDDAALACGLAVAVLQCRDSAIAQVD
eukprot:COSAG02_NODE_1613_length_11675_cov_8.562716_7_plen_68_part_00